MAGKKFSNVVLDEAVEPAKNHAERNKAAKPDRVGDAASTNKRFRIELTEVNSKKRTFPIRNDIGLSLDRYCIDHNVDRQTLVNLMIKEFLEKHPEGVKFEKF